MGRDSWRIPAKTEEHPSGEAAPESPAQAAFSVQRKLHLEPVSPCLVTNAQKKHRTNDHNRWQQSRLQRVRRPKRSWAAPVEGMRERVLRPARQDSPCPFCRGGDAQC